MSSYTIIKTFHDLDHFQDWTQKQLVQNRIQQQQKQEEEEMIRLQSQAQIERTRLCQLERERIQLQEQVRIEREKLQLEQQKQNQKSKLGKVFSSTSGSFSTQEEKNQDQKNSKSLICPFHNTETMFEKKIFIEAECKVCFIDQSSMSLLVCGHSLCESCCNKLIRK
jgi:hypothetical protein